MKSKTVTTRHGYHIWTAKEATVKDIEDAPHWTVFPGAKNQGNQDALPLGPEPGEPGYPVPRTEENKVQDQYGEYYEGEGEFAAWFPSFFNNLATPYAHEAAAHGFDDASINQNWSYKIESDDMMTAEYDDMDAAVEAIAAGWTLLKAPGRGARPVTEDRHYQLYVLDQHWQRNDEGGFKSVRGVYLNAARQAKAMSKRKAA